MDSIGNPKLIQKKKLKKLKPSGVVSSIMVDPNASSDDEEVIMKLKMKKGGRPSQMEVEAIEQQKNAKKEAARKKEKIK